MVVNGPLRQEELFGDLLIGQLVTDELNDFYFAFTQSGHSRIIAFKIRSTYTENFLFDQFIREGLCVTKFSFKHGCYRSNKFRCSDAL